MSDDTQAPMKPQDTVIYLLGELKGQVSSLKGSVDTSAASQAQVNIANEAEHAKFREAISGHASDIALLKQDNQVQQRQKLSTRAIAGLWISGCLGGLATISGVITAIYYLSHP